MGICYYCGGSIDIPFKCPYCNQFFCFDHRLPENHNCINIPERSWASYRHIVTSRLRLKPSKKVEVIKYPKVPSSVPLVKEEKPKAIINEQPKYSKTKSKTLSKKKIIILLTISIFVSSYFLFEDFKVLINEETDEILRKIKDYMSEYRGDVRRPIVNQKVNSTVFEDTDEKFQWVDLPEINLTELEFSIFRITNIEREKQGLKKLLWDRQLSIIAKEHSKDMADNEFFDHTNLVGEEPTDRARRHGYELYKDLGGGWYSEGIAENIATMATGNIKDVGYVNNDEYSIAEALVNSWMESEGHRENILDKSYDKIGIGVAYDGEVYLATQNFW